MKALVIGVGYLGRALADFLIEEGHYCATADLLQSKADFTVDLASRDSLLALAGLLQKSGYAPSCIFLCASTSGGSEDDYRAVYGKGTAHVAEAFPGAKIVMCSSSSVYGVKDGGWVTEVHSCHSEQGKSRILLDAEKLVLASGGVVARLSAIYGPGRCALLSRFMKSESLGEANRWVNYIHRDDAVKALVLIGMEDRAIGKIFNVADISPMQLAEIYEVLQDLLQKPAPEFNTGDGGPDGRQRGKSNQRVSCSLLLSMGWEPLYPSFADGIYHVLEDMGISLSSTPSKESL